MSLLLNTDQPAESFAEPATKAGFACLATAAAVAVSAAAISSNRHSGVVGTALVATAQVALVLLATCVVLRWRVRRAEVPREMVSLEAFVSAAAWLAPLAVLCLDRSWLSLPVAGAFAVLASVAFRALPSEDLPTEPEPVLTFMLPVRRQDAKRALAIKAASGLAYAGVALGFTVSVPLAALLIGSAAALIAWFQLTPDVNARAHHKMSTVTALFVSILTTLTPAASMYPSGGQYQQPADALNERGKGLHTGIVVMTTAKTESYLTAPPSPKRRDGARSARSVPLSIPFTGEYWIFYWPRRRPGADASRTYGSPLTAAYRSTDNESFLMEARQPLAASIDTACCRAMDVVFDSRDPQSESVLLELVLLDTSAPEPLRRSLGAASLQPSFSGEGSVRFEIASAGEIQSFNEILVRFHLEQPRQLHSARVAIKRFDLVP